MDANPVRLEHKMLSDTGRFMGNYGVAVVAMAIAVSAGALRGQGAVPSLGASSSELRSALRGQIGTHYSLSLAFLAAQETTTPEELVSIGRDEREDQSVRANAWSALAFMPTDRAAEALLGIAENAGPYQRIAWETLQTFTQRSACEFWRRVLRGEDSAFGLARHFAIAGLSYCGDENDIGLLESAATGPGFEAEVMARYRARLRSPIAERFDGTLLSGRTPGGRYVLPPAAAQRVSELLCGGPCPSGMVVGPELVSRLRAAEGGGH